MNIRHAAAALLALLMLLLALTVSRAASAATYYVRQDGNDQADGQSHATAWRTLARVNSHSFSPGDDVYLESGSVFDREFLVIDWPGTATNPAIVGCYYLDADNGDAPTSCDQGSGQGLGALPSIRGALTDDCIAAHDCDYTSDFVAGGIYSGLIRIHADYVTVQDLSVSYTKSSGVRLSEARGARIARVLVEVTGIAPVVLGSARETVVRDSTVRRYNQCEIQEHQGGPTPGLANCGKDGWPGGVVVVNSPDAEVLVENNDVYLGYGEGINCLRSSRVIIRGNRVGNVHSGGIYFDGCSRSVAEHNMLWGSQGEPSSADWGGGMRFNIEDTACCKHQLNGNVVRNNIMVDTGSCINAAMQPEAEAAGLLLGAGIYGNTCVSAVTFDLRINGVPDANIEQWDALGNVFFTTDGEPMGSTSPPCSVNPTAVVDYNLWAVANADDDCEGDHDAPDGDPLLAQSAYDSWDQVSYANPPELDDFRLREDSPARGAGDPSLATSKVLDAADYAAVLSEMAYPFAPTEAAWEMALAWDFEGKPRDEQAPDLGALEYGVLTGGAAGAGGGAAGAGPAGGAGQGGTTPSTPPGPLGEQTADADAEGCSCRTPARSPASTGAHAMWLLAMLLLLVRRADEREVA